MAAHDAPARSWGSAQLQSRVPISLAVAEVISTFAAGGIAQVIADGGG